MRWARPFSSVAIRGQFLVHTKHVNATMDSEAEGDERDLRDMPDVQHFKDGHALHLDVHVAEDVDGGLANAF